MSLFEPEKMELTTSQTTQNSVLVKNNNISEIRYTVFGIEGLLSKIKKPE